VPVVGAGGALLVGGAAIEAVADLRTVQELAGHKTITMTVGTFTFLGFTHYCGRRHKTDTFTVWRLTSKQRMVLGG
jgi:hypothetical protein